MLTVHLEPYEIERARQVGFERHLRGGTNTVHYQQFADDDDASYDVKGAIAEIAVAKALGLYWHGHGGALDRRNAYRYLTDVGSDVEVRHVTKPHYGPMIRQSDFDLADQLAAQGRSLLVVAAWVQAPRVDILGAIHAEAARQLSCPTCKRFVDAGRLAVGVCQSHLWNPDPDDWPDIIYNQRNP